jgi:hypothetical protein
MRGKTMSDSEAKPSQHTLLIKDNITWKKKNLVLLGEE